MAEFRITGGKKLYGQVSIQTAKNSAVALISAALLSHGGVFLRDCPRIFDVMIMVKILKTLGAEAHFSDDGLYVNCDGIKSTSLPERHTKKVRASFFTIGALIGRYGCATICQPGGCNIGSRPVDIHLEGLKKLGANCSERDGLMTFCAEKLIGTRIRLKYPSVGATENLMMAASTAKGTTRLENCAQEPEIVDLQKFLNLIGAKIRGAGTPFITIDGVDRLSGGVEFTPVSDRIEAGTYLLAAASVGGEVHLKKAHAENILPLIEILKNNACKIYINNDNIYIKGNGKLKGFGEIVTAPYPGFPTDLHPQLAACAIKAQGVTRIKETVFDMRFDYARELKKFGAELSFNSEVITLQGKEDIVGAKVFAKDLRGGAGLCLAALNAQGTSVVADVEHLDRGYESFEKKLSHLGADIVRT